VVLPPDTRFLVLSNTTETSDVCKFPVRKPVLETVIDADGRHESISHEKYAEKDEVDDVPAASTTEIIVGDHTKKMILLSDDLWYRNKTIIEVLVLPMRHAIEK
jgi:hypothetical protein